jgi:N utilization substance protein B
VNTQIKKVNQKSAARFYSVQALFQMEHSGLSIEVVISEFEEHRIGAVYNNTEFGMCNISLFKDILNLAVLEQTMIDKATDRALAANWPIDRIDPTLRAIFRAAGAEMLLGKTPPKVTIVEFIDVANAFLSDNKGLPLVNAVLDKMSRELSNLKTVSC